MPFFLWPLFPGPSDTHLSSQPRAAKMPAVPLQKFRITFDDAPLVTNPLFFPCSLVRRHLYFSRCEIGVVAFGIGLGVGRSRLSCPRMTWTSVLATCPHMYPFSLPSMSLSCTSPAHIVPVHNCVHCTRKEEQLLPR